MRRTWFTVQAAADKPAVISLFDEIGMWGISAKDFIGAFNQIEASEITLEINSPGGSVFDGIAIYNALKSSGKTIHVKVLGVAASIASVIAMAGDKISMPANTFMMVHNPWGVTAGTADDMREYADLLDKLGASLTSTYVARTGKTPEEIADMLSKDTWMTAAEALANGFADEVTDEVAVSAKFDAEQLPDNIKALFAKPVPPAAAAEAFADQVLAAVVGAGFSDDLAIQMALDETLTSMALVNARLDEAREIKALCAVTKRDADAAALISTGKTLAEARTYIAAQLAKGDETTTVDTTVMNSNKQSTSASPPAVTTAGVWATRFKNGVKK